MNMLTLDILICTLNNRIVRIPDLLMPEQEGVHYIVSFQYTKDSYLEIIPPILMERKDVTFVKLRGEGISANRNNALKYATADLVYLLDDDTRFLADTAQTIFETFNNHPDVDIALFKAQTYVGRELRKYPDHSGKIDKFHDFLSILTDEMVCRREKVQGKIQYDDRFGLGSHFLSCYETQIYLIDAIKAGLKMEYFDKYIIQTSTIFSSRLIYVDLKVQRSLGSLLYYIYGYSAYAKAFSFAFTSFRKRLAHFFPLFNHLLQGISYIRRTPKRL